MFKIRIRGKISVIQPVAVCARHSIFKDAMEAM